MNKFSVKNFKVFGSEGTEIEFKPVTILTGTNSSGKSSYVKALLLFKDYIDRMRNDYQKNGYFNPAAYNLDFTKADLKLKGFANSLNRKAQEPVISFAIEIDLNDILGTYRVEYSFRSGKDSRELEIGILDSIRVFCDDELLLSLRRDGKSLIIKSMNLRSSVFEQFLCYEAAIVCPEQIMESFNEKDEISQFITSDDEIDFHKMGETQEGHKLYNIQKNVWPSLQGPVFDADSAYEFRHFENEDYVRSCDLSEALVKTFEYDLFFYFPILELFKGHTKDECVSILRNKAGCGTDIQELAPNLNPIKCYSIFGKELDKTPLIEELINDFEDAKEESFIDYYRRLEKDFLTTAPYHRLEPASDRNYDYIKDSLLYDVDLSFNNERGWGSQKSSTFHRAYYVLSAWQWYEDEQIYRTDKASSLYTDNAYVKREVIGEYYLHRIYSMHKMYDVFIAFLGGILKNVLLPSDLTDFTYFNESFSVVRRLYTFEENTLLTKTVTDFLEESKRTRESKDDRFAGKIEYSPGQFSSKWLKKLEIGGKLNIETDSEGLGFKISIQDFDKNTESLADLGHGVTQIVQLLLLLEARIMSSIRLQNRETIKRMTHTGYFQSRVTLNYVTTPTLVIEEPEVSLHPSMQSKLADMFAEAAKDYKVSFIIETHSEYLVRKTQAIVARMNNEEYENNPFVVYYFNRDGSAYDMEYTESGRFANSFGTGFFDEAGKCSIEVLRREKEAKK